MEIVLLNYFGDEASSVSTCVGVCVEVDSVLVCGCLCLFDGECEFNSK